MALFKSGLRTKPFSYRPGVRDNLHSKHVTKSRAQRTHSDDSDSRSVYRSIRSNQQELARHLAISSHEINANRIAPRSPAAWPRISSGEIEGYFERIIDGSFRRPVPMDRLSPRRNSVKEARALERERMAALKEQRKLQRKGEIKSNDAVAETEIKPAAQSLPAPEALPIARRLTELMGIEMDPDLVVATQLTDPQDYSNPANLAIYASIYGETARDFLAAALVNTPELPRIFENMHNSVRDPVWLELEKMMALPMDALRLAVTNLALLVNFLQEEKIITAYRRVRQILGDAAGMKLAALENAATLYGFREELKRFEAALSRSLPTQTSETQAVRSGPEPRHLERAEQELIRKLNEIIRSGNAGDRKPVRAYPVAITQIAGGITRFRILVRQIAAEIQEQKERRSDQADFVRRVEPILQKFRDFYQLGSWFDRRFTNQNRLLEEYASYFALLESAQPAVSPQGRKPSVRRPTPRP